MKSSLVVVALLCVLASCGAKNVRKSPVKTEEQPQAPEIKQAPAPEIKQAPTPQIKQAASASVPSTDDDFDCPSFPCLIFEDNFDTLDFSKWNHEITAGGGGNWEFQYYTNNRSNSYVRDGNLYIKPTLTDDKFYPGFVSSGSLEIWGNTPATECTGNQFYGCFRQGTVDNYINPVQSARLRTVKNFNFNYGRVDIEAKIPKGDWIWPALWMMPTYEEYGGWPSSGEIDIMESRGNLDLKDEQGVYQGHQSVASTMHWGPFFEVNSYDRTTQMTTKNDGTGYGDGFHKYSVVWNNNDISFYVDDVESLRVDPGTSFWDFGDFDTRVPDIDNPWSEGSKMAPFDKTFYIIMNVAVGGTNGFFSDSWTNAAYPKPWLNTSPTGPKDFWLAKDSWYPTWNADANNGEDAAMAINYVRVYKMTADDM